MKILYSHNSSKHGGMEQHVLDLVRGMLSAGHEVFVWCPEGKPYEFYKEAGAEVENKKINSDFDRTYIEDLSAFLVSKKIDVMHSHELKAASNALLAAKNAGTPVKVTHVHTPISEWKISGIKKKIDTLFYSYIVNRMSDAEIALTDSKKQAKIGEGIKEDKIVVIPNGLDVEKLTVTPAERIDYGDEMRKRLGIGKNTFVFGNLGRISREKGHDVLINAYKKFLSTDMYHSRDFILVIAGGGELEEEIKSLAVTKGVSERVIFAGEFSAEDLVKYYSLFDLFLFPTLAEGFGLVLIEAMYSGLPVICSDLEVLREVADDTVTYFRTSDYINLSEKMIEAYETHATSGKPDNLLGKERVLEKYTLEAFIASYISLYERFLKNR